MSTSTLVNSEIDINSQKQPNWRNRLVKRLEHAFWNQYARFYDNLSKYFLPYQALVVEVCDHVEHNSNRQPLRILDAGCGTGNYTWELTRRGNHVIGIDNSPVMLDHAEAKRKTDAHYPDFRQHDLATPLPFDPNSFDAALCVHVLYTMQNPRAFLQQLRTVVHQQGCVVLVTLQRPVDLIGSITDSLKVDGWRAKLQILRAAVGVALLNMIINLKQRQGVYQLMNEVQLGAAITEAGFSVITTATTYTRGVSALVVGGKP